MQLIKNGKSERRILIPRRPDFKKTEDIGKPASILDFSEYKERKEAFFEAQMNMFCRDIKEKLKSNGHNLTAVNWGVYELYENTSLAFNETIKTKVFWDAWGNHYSSRLTKLKDWTNDDIRRMEGKTYTHNVLFYQAEMCYEGKDAFCIERTLRKDKLTVEEQKECLVRAKEMYEIFKVSDAHYAALKTFNPHVNFLRDIAVIYAKLSASKVLEEIKTATALEFMHLPDTENQYLTAKTQGNRKVTLTNCIRACHEDIVKRGDSLLYVPRNYEPNIIIGDLAHIVRQ